MSSPFVKQLVASDRKTRDAALASLTKFLGSSRHFEQVELLKLWKALFYCFWHSDRTLVQQALAQDLANLCLSIKEYNFIPFLKAFWSTMCREWNSIDILRLDKFYTLLRRFIGAVWSRLIVAKWDKVLLQEYIQVLEDLPLSVCSKKIPNGVRYHVADIYIEELGKALGDKDKSQVPIEVLMRPFEQLLTQSPTKSVRLRVTKAVFDDKSLLDYGYEMATADDVDEEEQVFSQNGHEDQEMLESSNESDDDTDDDQDDEEFAGFD